jgi:hypothetical protein
MGPREASRPLFLSTGASGLTVRKESRDMQESRSKEQADRGGKAEKSRTAVKWEDAGVSQVRCQSLGQDKMNGPRHRVHGAPA